MTYNILVKRKGKVKHMITGIFTQEEIEQLNEMYELTSKIIERMEKNNEVYIDTSVGMYNINDIYFVHGVMFALIHA